MRAFTADEWVARLGGATDYCPVRFVCDSEAAAGALAAALRELGYVSGAEGARVDAALEGDSRPPVCLSLPGLPAVQGPPEELLRRVDVAGLLAKARSRPPAPVASDVEDMDDAQGVPRSPPAALDEGEARAAKRARSLRLED